jgi:hypothetical protein
MSCVTGDLLVSTPFQERLRDYAATMIKGHVDSCGVCWALVPRTLMHFHRRWHDESEHTYSSSQSLALRPELERMPS